MLAGNKGYVKQGLHRIYIPESPTYHQQVSLPFGLLVLRCASITRPAPACTISMIFSPGPIPLQYRGLINHQYHSEFPITALFNKPRTNKWSVSLEALRKPYSTNRVFPIHSGCSFPSNSRLLEDMSQNPEPHKPYYIRTHPLYPLLEGILSVGPCRNPKPSKTILVRNTKATQYWHAGPSLVEIPGC